MKKLIFALTLMFTAPSFAQAVLPHPQSATHATQPVISASFDQRVANNARIWIDGTEFSGYARRDGNTVSLVPPYNLDYGVHQVRVDSGRGQTANWSFSIQNPNGTAWTRGNNWNNGRKPQPGWNNGKNHRNDGYYDKKGKWHRR